MVFSLSYFAGIPTNVVNPIQQYNHSNPRPTNRVLPMQTQHKVPSPPHTPPEPKPRIEPDNKKPIVIHDITIIKNDRVTVTQQSPNSSIILINSKPDNEMMSPQFSSASMEKRIMGMSSEEQNEPTTTNAIDMQMDNARHNNDDDDDDIFTKDSDLLDSDSAKDSDSMDLPDIKETYLGGNPEAAFDKLKNDTTVMMIPSSQSQSQPLASTSVPDAIAESIHDPEPEQEQEMCARVDDVKEKISEILDNLEQEANEKSMLATQELYNLGTGDANMHETDADMLDVEPKENLNPTMSTDSTSFDKYQKTAMATETFRPKPTGPQMLYEIQSDDGFTCTSTSINDLWEKVFELVQVGRKSHGLTPLPEGPMADMCGHQMVGLKANAVKYLLEQLPGVEHCTNYTPVYHKRAQSTLSQDASSGYFSDYEDLKENYYGAARLEGFNDRAEYDMFGWLASRHRKQPVQIHMPLNTHIDSNIK